MIIRLCPCGSGRECKWQFNATNTEKWQACEVCRELKSAWHQPELLLSAIINETNTTTTQENYNV